MPNAPSYLARFDIAEAGLCQWMQRAADWSWSLRLFRAAGRLGDGVVWYVLAAALILTHGAAAVRVVGAMALTGVSGVLLYKALKARLVRERPFIRHAGIRPAMPPLDRYSFPSGHTMHAVSFTWQVVRQFPELTWVLIPLAAAIAISRVVLGLHYPTDVLAGAALGSGMALTGIALAG